ncbi:MAG: hypothetical protein DMG31_11750 [Acidobacteria bacterium]|nr:MAG: hypothetical protein DMG31_11750 [Acidobacteriota bacterium]
MSKLTIRRILLLSILLLGSVNFVRAQRVSPYFGVGTARDSAGTSVKEGCPTGQLFDGVICEAAPKMRGLFGVAGVDFLFKPHLGVNGEYVFRLHQAPFLPDDSLNMRPVFYDVNALWQPVTGKRLAPFFEGGVGLAKVALHFTQTTSLTGVTSTSGFSAGSDQNHFQLHGAIGAKIYIRGNMFVRPQFDLRYATHLTDQFRRNLMVQFSGSVGYSFGGR